METNQLEKYALHACVFEKEMLERVEHLRKLVAENEEIEAREHDKDQWLFLEGLRKALAIIDGEAP